MFYKPRAPETEAHPERARLGEGLHYLSLRQNMWPNSCAGRLINNVIFLGLVMFFSFLRFVIYCHVLSCTKQPPSRPVLYLQFCTFCLRRLPPETRTRWKHTACVSSPSQPFMPGGPPTSPPEAPRRLKARPLALGHSSAGVPPKTHCPVQKTDRTPSTPAFSPERCGLMSQSTTAALLWSSPGPPRGQPPTRCLHSTGASVVDNSVDGSYGMSGKPSRGHPRATLYSHVLTTHACFHLSHMNGIVHTKWAA